MTLRRKVQILNDVLAGCRPESILEVRGIEVEDLREVLLWWHDLSRGDQS